MSRALSKSIYLLAGLVGLVSFAYPILAGQIAKISPFGRSVGPLELPNTTLLTFLLIIICLGVLLMELQGQAVNAKVVASLGILVAVASVLRLLETAIPGPGGFSPIFVPIILAGFVYGARFGFLMGSLTMLASALITGGIGPWLPYQMIVAGWIGMTAGWLPKIANKKVEIAQLALFGFGWGILFGFILNLYFWPFVNNEAGQIGSSLGEVLARYGAFYFSTSFIWDIARALGNAAIILALGIPVVRALNRFRDRLHFNLL